MLAASLSKNLYGCSNLVCSRIGQAFGKRERLNAQKLALTGMLQHRAGRSASPLRMRSGSLLRGGQGDYHYTHRYAPANTSDKYFALDSSDLIPHSEITSRTISADDSQAKLMFACQP